MNKFSVEFQYKYTQNIFKKGENIRDCENFKQANGLDLKLRTLDTWQIHRFFHQATVGHNDFRKNSKWPQMGTWFMKKKT